MMCELSLASHPPIAYRYLKLSTVLCGAVVLNAGTKHLALAVSCFFQRFAIVQFALVEKQVHTPACKLICHQLSYL